MRQPKSAHEKCTAPIVAKQTSAITTSMQKRACIFTQIKIHTYSDEYSVCLANTLYHKKCHLSTKIALLFCEQCYSMKDFEKGVGKTFAKVFPTKSFSYLLASSTATATATVIPTMGLLPISVAQES